MRSVAYKHTAERTMCVLSNFRGKRGWTANTDAARFVEAAQNLYRHLHHGFVGKGIHRVPIAGDTTQLSFAADVSPLERRLAWSQHFLARHLPGSQQVRQLMGHSHFGARVIHGDCIFFTISPNEQHSALVLRLSRFRRNDPFLKYRDDATRRLASKDFPMLEESSIDIALPEYDLRRAATCRDPLAVVEGYRIETYLRLATVLGVRMCPHCPRCNLLGKGCQDRFGSNMRPMGGVLGGMSALGGSTEYQGMGTPHLHAEGHVVCAYQYDTMQEIEMKFRSKKLSVEAWKQYNSWLHHEDVFEPAEHAAFAEKLDAEFFDRLRKPEHDGMTQIPRYLVEDARVQSREDTHTVSSSAGMAERRALYEDAEMFMQNYKRDLQFIFSRVQHHCHKRTAKGYVPLKACRMKSRGKRKVRTQDKCKAGFPLTHLKTDRAVLVCRGIAKRFKLRISGRRNAFGGMVGKRRCEWQSATTPAFAAMFRSNTHTLPNYRAPILPETHEDEMCQSRVCRASMQDPKEKKNMAKMAQRACRECCGYHSGYTFKRQPVGAKYVAAAAETLNYVTTKMRSKSGNQKYHYMSHRILQDLQHRCMARPATDEWNLAVNWHEQDEECGAPSHV